MIDRNTDTDRILRLSARVEDLEAENSKLKRLEGKKDHPEHWCCRCGG